MNKIRVIPRARFTTISSNPRALFILLLFLILMTLHPADTMAMGNHPESGVCTLEKPFQAICTHSLHNLEGWYGPCYDNKQQAQQDADKHANKQHNGNSRYTGIKKALVESPPGY